MNKLLYLTVIYTVVMKCSSFRISPTLMADIIREVSSVYNTQCVEVLVHRGLTREESEGYDKLFRLLSSRHITKLQDMDESEETKVEGDLSATKCFRPIRVTIGNELSRLPFQKVSFWCGNAISRPVSLVFMNTTIETYFQNVSLPYNLIIIAAEMLEEDLLEMYEVYRVDVNFPMHVDKVGNWTMKTGIYVNPRTVFSRRFDFEGKLFRTGSIEKWPFSTFNGFLDKSEPWDGLYCAVWSELGRLLNFKSINYRGDTIGISYSRGRNWTGLINHLLKNEIDVIVADTRLTNSRLKVLDFTYPLTSSWYQIYYRQPGYRLRWSAVFEPFNYDVWVAILIWIFVGALCFYVSFHVCVTRGLEPEDGQDLSFLDSFFFMLRTLSFQDYNSIPNTVVCRAVFLTAYVAAAVLLPAYSASFISFLTQHSPKRPFDSLEGLLKDGTYKLLLEENTSEYAYFARASDKTLQKIYRKLVQPIPGIHYTNYSSYGLEMLCRHKKVALFDVQQLIEMKNTAGLKCELLSLTQTLTKVDNGIAFAKGDPYAIYIHHHVHRMTEAGLIRRIRRKVSPKIAKHFLPWNPVKLEEVFQIFSFLLIGIITAIIIFFGEIGYRNFRTRTKSKNEGNPFEDHDSQQSIPHNSLHNYIE